MRRAGASVSRHVLRGSTSACSTMTTPALSRRTTSSPSSPPAAHAAQSHTSGSSLGFIKRRPSYCAAHRGCRGRLVDAAGTCLRRTLARPHLLVELDRLARNALPAEMLLHTSACFPSHGCAQVRIGEERIHGHAEVARKLLRV